MKVTILEPLNVNKEDVEKYKDGSFELEYYENVAKTDEELYERAKDSEILVIANTKFSSEVLQKLTKTKYISIAFTGFDHIDVKLAKEKNIILSNSKGYSDICVAELVIGQVLNVYRLSSKKYNEIYGKTVGILGHGKIGKRVHKLFISLGAKVIYYDPNDKKTQELEYVLKNSDIVTLHMPYNEKTKDFMNYEKMNLLKKDAILINMAREGVLNTKDLKKILDENKLKAVILDVVNNRELIENYPNVHITNHIAYLTEESMKRRLEICMNNVLEYLKGNVINEI